MGTELQFGMLKKSSTNGQWGLYSSVKALNATELYT